MTPRILIVGSTYVYDQAMVELTKLWSRVMAHLNPGIDIVLIDPASPFEPSEFLGWPISTDADFSEKKLPPKSVYRLPENVGHLSRGGEDGAGRCFCKAFELAAAGGYDYMMFCEADILFFRPAAPIIQRMINNGTKVAALPNLQYQFPEFGVSFYDVRWSKEFNFVEKYNWRKSQPYPIPEVRLMNILDEYLMLLPLYGARVDQIPMTGDTLPNFFPYGPPAWITHATDFNIYMRAITLNGINLR